MTSGGGAARTLPPASPLTVCSLRSRSFILSTLGFTAVAFVTGSLALWAPTFLFRAAVFSGQKAPCADEAHCASSERWLLPLAVCRLQARSNPDPPFPPPQPDLRHHHRHHRRAGRVQRRPGESTPEEEDAPSRPVCVRRRPAAVGAVPLPGHHVRSGKHRRHIREFRTLWILVQVLVLVGLVECFSL